jgi:hypothetical protein
MPNEIVVVSEPSEAEYEAIVAPLRAYNEAKGGPSGYMPIAFLLRDSNGANVGGLWGKIAYDWLFVEPAFCSGKFKRQWNRIETSFESRAFSERTKLCWSVARYA